VGEEEQTSPYLISTRAWSKVSVREIKLLDAKRATVLLIIEVCVFRSHGCRRWLREGGSNGVVPS
jgi:hypothetical protein